jgi:hypothetical protein
MHIFEGETMSVTKQYDEMEDRHIFAGSEHAVFEKKEGSAKFSIHVSAQYVKLPTAEDVLWLVVKRVDLDWLWSSDSTGVLLVDGQRLTFQGDLRSYDSFWGPDTLFFEASLQVYEEVHIPFEPKILAVLGGAKSAKMRLGGVDFELPAALFVDIGEIMKSVE